MQLKPLVQKYRYAWVFIFYPLFSSLYFVAQTFVAPRYLVESALDAYIPFCELFIIPYVVWYAYVAVALVFFLFRSRESFLKLALFLFTGMFFTLALYVLWPNGIAFRPETFPRDNVFVDLVKIIYGNDRPAVVCPSMHCLNAIAVHIAIVKSPHVIRWRWVRIASLVLMILICLSTVFIKQHSVIDVAVAAVLSVGLYWLAYKIKWPFLKTPTPQAPLSQEPVM